MYDVVIIGGGPGGVAAGVYAARKQLKALFITDSFLSQSAVSASIENWIGTVTMAGWEFAQSLEKHVRAQSNIEIKTGEKAVAIEEISDDGKRGYAVATNTGGRYETRTVIVASGGRHKHLDVPGEEKFKGKGVVYCSTCDAPFFRGKTVAVVGGGNAGLEAVEDLLPYAEKIYLVVRYADLKGDKITQEKILASPKVDVIYNAESEEVVGEDRVTGFRYKKKQNGESHEIAVDGVFVEIGMIPNTEFLKGVVEMNERGEIIIDARTAATSRPGIFATGDATDVPYKQNNISAGFGVTAALSAYDYIRKDKMEIDK